MVFANNFIPSHPQQINCWENNDWYSPSVAPVRGSQWSYEGQVMSDTPVWNYDPLSKFGKRKIRSSFGSRYFAEKTLPPGYTDVSGILLGPSAFQWENSPLDRALNAE